MAGWKDISDESGRKFELALESGLRLRLSEDPQRPSAPWRLDCVDWFVAMPIPHPQRGDVQRLAVMRAYGRLIAAASELFRNVHEDDKGSIIDMLAAFAQVLASGAEAQIVLMEDPPTGLERD